jgi:ABC-type bacteriocin/lantibiotic exporter with double-glycine peptidase domain
MNRGILLHALRSLAGKLTMVVAAHRLSTVVNCDQLIDLANETLQLPPFTQIEVLRFLCLFCIGHGCL